MRSPPTVWVALALGSAACEAGSTDLDAPSALPAYQDPAQSGPYPIGLHTAWIEDVAGYEPIPVEVWYPAAEPGPPGSYDFMGLRFPTDAARDVPGDPSAPNRLILFSHGLGGARHQNLSMAERLASHGYIVVAPDHPGTTTLDFLASFDDLGPDLVRRPAVVSAAADHLFDGGVPGVQVRGDGYGLIGHSLGAWTSLAVAGGALSLQTYEQACAARPAPRGCRIIGEATYSEAEIARYGQPDPRVITTILQSPGGHYSFDEDSLRRIDHPLVMGAPLDTTLPYEAETRAVYERAGTSASMVTFEGAGHYGYTDMCLLPVATLFADDCDGEEAGFADPDQIQDRSNTYVVAWMGARLLGEAAFEAHLTDTEGANWETRMGDANGRRVDAVGRRQTSSASGTSSHTSRKVSSKRSSDEQSASR